MWLALPLNFKQALSVAAWTKYHPIYAFEHNLPTSPLTIPSTLQPTSRLLLFSFFPAKFNCVGVWSTYQGLVSLKETDSLSSISSQVSTTSYLASGGISCPSCPLWVFLSDWSLCRSCACVHNHCELKYVLVLFLENVVSVILSTTIGSYNFSASSSTKISKCWDKGCGTNVPLRSKHCAVFYSAACWPIKGLCVNYHIL